MLFFCCLFENFLHSSLCFFFGFVLRAECEQNDRRVKTWTHSRVVLSRRCAKRACRIFLALYSLFICRKNNGITELKKKGKQSESATNGGGDTNTHKRESTTSSFLNQFSVFLETVHQPEALEQAPPKMPLP